MSYTEKVQEEKHALFGQEVILCGVTAHDAGPEEETMQTVPVNKCFLSHLYGGLCFRF